MSNNEATRRQFLAGLTVAAVPHLSVLVLP